METGLSSGSEFGMGIMKEDRPQRRRRVVSAPPRKKMQPLGTQMEDFFLELNFAMIELCLRFCVVMPFLCAVALCHCVAFLNRFCDVSIRLNK